MAAQPATLYSLGGIVQWIDESVNNAFVVGIAQNVQRVTEGIWPLLEICTLLSLLIYGFLVASQQISTPFGRALVNMVKIAFVVGLLETGGLYQTHIMGMMLALPNDMMSLIAGEPVSAVDSLTDFLNSSIETSTHIVERAPSMLTQLGKAILFMIVAAIMQFLYVMMTVIGLLMLMIAKVGMALIVTVGPFFIAFALFDQTKEFFKLWLQQAVFYGLYAAMFSIMFLTVMGMLGYIQQILLGMVQAAEINIFQIFAVLVLVGLVSIFLFKVPVAVTRKITQGFSINMPFIGDI